MTDKDSGREQTSGTFPPLSQHQLQVVALAIGSALNATYMAYGRAIGPQRFHELDEFRGQLLAGIKNADITGMSMSAEPAVIETIYAIVAANIPKVKRVGDNDESR